VDLLDLLAREGLLDKAAIEEVRARGEPAVAAVVEAGFVAEDVLADVVAREAGTVVIDLDRGTIERDAVHLLPSEIAKRQLVIVVAVEPGGRAVRAAFADPFDERALAEVAAATGRAVRVLVGTVSAIRRAIAREYAQPPSTPTLAGARERPELLRESTRRVSVPRRQAGSALESEGEEGPRTLPLHRFEQEATIEQRHEALLLALIEKGWITRADYTEALKRLLGRG
jgi:hypothetical protein